MAACRGGCSISSGGGASPADSLMFEVVRNRVARGGRLSADSREAVRRPNSPRPNNIEERALMADRRHTPSRSEAEQLQIWEFDEIETT